MPPRRVAGPIERGVNRDLRLMGKEAKASALGALAVSLARRSDIPHVTASAAAQLAKELRATLLELAREFPPEREADELEKLREAGHA